MLSILRGRKKRRLFLDERWWFVCVMRRGLLLAAVIVGCFAAGPVSAQEIGSQKSEGAAATSGAATQPAAERKLAVGDFVKVTWKGPGTPPTEVLIERQLDVNGNVLVKSLGRLHVGGLTEKEAAEVIEGRADKFGLLLPRGERDVGARVRLRWLERTPERVARLAPVKPGEVLRVKVFELVTPGQYYEAELRVDANGVIEIPLVRKVPVEGKSPDDIEGQIVDRLKEWERWPTTNTPGPEVEVVRVVKEEAGTRPAGR